VLDMLREGNNAVLRIRNFGDKSLAEMRSRLEELGYLAYLEAGTGEPGEGEGTRGSGGLVP